MIFIVIALLCVLFSYIGTRSLKTSLWLSVLSGIFIYLSLPVINWSFCGLPFIVTIISGFCLHYAYGHKRLSYFSALVFSAGLVFLSLIPLLTSWNVFYQADYQTLIGHIDREADNSDKPVFSATLLVDEKNARRLAEQTLQTSSAAIKQFTLGKMTLQSVNDDLLWVGPLTYPNIQSWWKNSGGTPGYVSVSATHSNTVRIVTKIDGKALHIKYQKSAWFNQDITRHIYQKGFHEKGFTDIHFEIDDQGRPYWIASLYKKSVGYYGEDANAVLRIEPSSGHIQEFNLESADDWIDYLHPPAFIKTQVQDWAKHIYSDDVRAAKPVLVHDKSGHSYWCTSISEYNLALGLILTDARTKGSYFFAPTEKEECFD